MHFDSFRRYYIQSNTPSHLLLSTGIDSDAIMNFSETIRSEMISIKYFY